jgi:uncharacterized cupin superfamily protein
LIFFSNKKEDAPQFYNYTDIDFKFIALSTKDRFEICEYPDSNKVLIRKAGKMLSAEPNLDYEEGEKNPKDFRSKKFF